MKSLALKLQRFLVSEDGPTAVEYAVMVALIIIVCLAAVQALGTHVRTEFTNITGSLT
jgi:pilus assembly protein Flp/PilA